MDKRYLLPVAEIVSAIETKTFRVTSERIAGLFGRLLFINFISQRTTMINTRIPITAKGAEKLKAELDYLKKTARPAVVAAIAEAREKGDLSENAEYDAAREEQGHIEGRIAELEGKIPALQIIDPASLEAGERIVFGATVTLYGEEDDSTVTYQIVGDDEADIKENKISISSPIARALIGKNEGDMVQFRAPKGLVSFEIESVEYI